MRSLHLRKLSVLTGENMLQFRSGKNLYPYCPDCVNVAMSPVSKTLGCTIGDDPDVVEYSSRLSIGETTADTEKCPGFDTAALDDGGTAPHEARRSDAIMVKEVPSADPIYQDDLHPDPLEQAYWAFDAERAETGAERDAFKHQLRKHQADLAIPVSGRDEMSTMYDMLDQAGVDQMAPDQQYDAVLDALVGWEGGLMAIRVTQDLVRSVLDDYLEIATKTAAIEMEDEDQLRDDIRFLVDSGATAFDVQEWLKVSYEQATEIEQMIQSGREQMVEQIRAVVMKARNVATATRHGDRHAV